MCMLQARLMHDVSENGTYADLYGEYWDSDTDDHRNNKRDQHWTSLVTATITAQL